jgi:hypothetical protein
MGALDSFEPGAKILHSFSLINLYLVMTLTLPSRRSAEVIFCSTILDIGKTTALLAGSQASPALPPVTNSMSLKMSVENWGKITDR